MVETLQSIKQSEMSPMLGRIYGSEGGPEILDVLMKYLYAVSARVSILLGYLADAYLHLQGTRECRKPRNLALDGHP